MSAGTKRRRRPRRTMTPETRSGSPDEPLDLGPRDDFGASRPGLGEELARVPLRSRRASQDAPAAAHAFRGVGHLRHGPGRKPHLIERLMEASGRFAPAGPVRVRYGHLPAELGELRVEIDAEGPEVMVHPQRVARGHGRRAARRPAPDEDHSVLRFGRPHRRKGQPDEPGVGEKPRPLELLEETQARCEGAELPSGLEDRDLERALEGKGRGRPRRAAADDDGPLHGRTSSKKKRARHSASPEVILCENSRRPPPQMPAMRPSSRDAISRHVSGV